MNNETLAANLDFISELRDKARIRDKAGKLWAARRYNSKVNRDPFVQETLFGGCDVMREKMKQSSPISGKDHSVSQA